LLAGPPASCATTCEPATLYRPSPGHRADPRLRGRLVRGSRSPCRRAARRSSDKACRNAGSKPDRPSSDPIRNITSPCGQLHGREVRPAADRSDRAAGEAKVSLLSKGRPGGFETGNCHCRYPARRSGRGPILTGQGWEGTLRGGRSAGKALMYRKQ